MIRPTLQLLAHAPAQAKEVGEFATAVLQRNIAVGAIVLLVMAVVALMVIIKRKDAQLQTLNDQRVTDQKEAADAFTDELKLVVEKYELLITKITEEHSAYDAERGKTFATEYKVTNDRMYDSLEKVTSALVGNSSEMRSLTDVIKERLR